MKKVQKQEALIKEEDNQRQSGRRLFSLLAVICGVGGLLSLLLVLPQNTEAAGELSGWYIEFPEYCTQEWPNIVYRGMDGWHTSGESHRCSNFPYSGSTLRADGVTAAYSGENDHVFQVHPHFK